MLEEKDLSIAELQARMRELEAENKQLHGRVQALLQTQEPLSPPAPETTKLIELHLDPDGHIEPRNELARRTFTDLTFPLRHHIHPIFHKAFALALQQAQETQRPQQVDALVECEQYPAIFARLTIASMSPAVGWAVRMSPITPEETNRFLRQGEPSYRDIAELTQSYAYAVVITEAGQLVPKWVTGAFTQLTGYELSDLLQWPDAQQIIHPDDLEHLLQRVVQWHQGQANEGEYRLVTKDGRVIWIMDRVQPVWDSRQDRVVYLYGLGHDITRRKEVQLELEASQRRHKHLIESTFDLVQIVDNNGKFQLVNQAWQDTLGYTSEEWPELTIWDILHPDEREHCQTLLAQIRLGEYLPHIQTRLVTKHGRVLTVEGSATPNFDENQNIIGTNGFLHDITAQVAAADELRRYTSRLEILRAIDQAIVTAQSIQETATSTLQHLRRIVSCDRASITLFNNQQEAFLFALDGQQTSALEVGAPVEAVEEMLAHTARTPHDYVLLPDFAETDLSVSPPLLRLQDAGYRTYLGVPLKADGETVGVLNLTHSVPGVFGAEEIHIASEVANHLAMALRQARLYEATQSQLKELRILHAVAQACAEAKTEDDLVRSVTEIIYAHELADLFGVLLLDQSTQQLVVHPGHEAVWPYIDLPPIALGEGITGQVAADMQARYIPNTAVEPSYLDLGTDMGAELCVPLISDGRVLGVLNAERRTINSFDSFAQRLLTTISGQLSLTMGRLHSERNTQRYAQQIISMNEMAQKVTRSLELDDVLQGIIDEVSALVEAEGVAVLLRHVDEPMLEFSAVSGPGAQGLQNQLMPIDKGVAGLVVRYGEPIAIYNRQQSNPLIYHRAEDMSGFRAQSLLAVPIIVDNDTLGVLEAVHSQPDQFRPEALYLLNAAATWAAIAIKNARLYAQLGDQYQQLQQSQAQLIQAEKLSALGRLVASIAHEINNPIQAIQGCLTLAWEELEDLDELAKLDTQPARLEKRQSVDMYLDIVQSELMRVANIVKRMRDFYRPASEGHYLTAVSEVLDSVLALSQKQLEYANVTVQRDWSANLPFIPANPNHLKQVFLNLLLNAVDAMPNGGQLLVQTRRATTVEEARLGHTAVAVVIQDSGQGIPPEELEHLFEPFFTTKDEGSGLGLSISYNIIQAHNGHLLVESTLGQGTTFTILLPTDGE